MGSQSDFREDASPPTSEKLNFLHQVAQPTALHTAARILQDSQLVGGSLPLSLDPAENHTRQLCNLIVVDDLLACDFLGGNAPAVTIPQTLSYQLQLVDCHTPKLLEEVDHPIASQATLLQLFPRGNAFRGTTGLFSVAKQWFKTLLRNNSLQALIIYGSPYVLEQLLPDLSPTTPYVFSYGQMPQAQAIALEVLFRNHSPD